MPLPDRALPTEMGTPMAGGGGSTTAAAGVGESEPLSQPLSELRRRALEVLLDPALAPIVDLVAWIDETEPDALHVADADGAVRLSRTAPDAAGWVRWGRNPLANQDPYDDNAYPFAGSRLANLFGDARAPDLVVTHTGRHYWPERGGHLGEHGSLNGRQSRAPLLLAGAGVAARGVLDGVARTVDVGATLARLCAASYQGMDGRPLRWVEPRARHVVGLLWDGAPSGELLAMAEAGELPALSRLLERGCVPRGGAIAEFPSVTLVNHTCALTGVGPGRHGIVHNAYYDRDTGERVVPNDASVWHRAMDFLRPGVPTVFERVAAARPEAFTACVNEPADRGADYSTFGLIRAAQESGEAPGGTRSLRDTLPPASADPHATGAFVADTDYAWGTQVDASGLTQVLDLWRDPASVPALTWWNSTLTDAGHHAGGPGSEIARAALRDTDRRLGVWWDRVVDLGLADDVVVLLTADHGFQAADPDCRGDWDTALRAAGVPFRDEGYGFLYLR